ncbi:hypothetical protein CHK_3021 [Christensenella hongkongensis]|uniref:Uncharacterized protein n=1 Tax=Christensenella hongkongensis TaxID=270498 RepID=A0A0M2NB20_9FIRM|nr:hypothetical protein CHK_3021 [Christensenella hongkongensis]
MIPVHTCTADGHSPFADKALLHKQYVQQGLFSFSIEIE